MHVVVVGKFLSGSWWLEPQIGKDNSKIRKSMMSDLKDSSLERAFAPADIWAPVILVRFCFPCVTFKTKNTGADFLDLKDEVQESIPPTEAIEGKQSCWGCVHFRLVGGRKKSNKWVEIFVHEKEQGGRESAKKGLNQGYSRPPMWKRIYRKLKAETKQVHVACCEGLCWPTEIVHYNTFNYEKNFDKGREYWQQDDSLSGKSSSGNLWKEDLDMSEIALKSSSPPINHFHVVGSSPKQRRKINSPSQLQGKKVWFAD